MLPDNIRETLHQHNDAAKLAAFEALHRAYGVVRVTLGADTATTARGIPADVIARFAGRALPLDIGTGLARPTALQVFDHKLLVRLSFGGVESECWIPWRAIEILQSYDRQETFAWITHPGNEVPRAKEEKPRGWLRVIKGGAG